MPATGSERGKRSLPRWTLRLRLTLLYGGLFLIAGTALLAIVYGLVRHDVEVSTTKQLVVRAVAGSKRLAPPESVFFSRAAATGPPPAPPGLPPALKRVTTQLQAQAQAQFAHERSDELDALLTRSGVALGIMAFLSIGLGWLMAGRALRPVRTMAVRARGISERNLHERLALEGPNDELKELGDTFDGLLARLEGAFESQRRFVANASHELRTPITVSRTLIEVALADRHASVQSLRNACERVLVAGEQQERLISALLTLARSQRGLQVSEELDLCELAGEVLRGYSHDGLRLEPKLAAAPIRGEHALIERMVANLIDNAIAYNVPGGWIGIETGVEHGRSVLRVENTGPVVGDEQVGVLLEPFRRLDGKRPANGGGLGLGLSIVSAIVTAHDAELGATPRAGGGLLVEVRFARRSDPVQPQLYTGARDGIATRGVADPAGAHR